MASSRRVALHRVVVLLTIGLLGSISELRAQKPAPAPPAHVEATRAELEAIVAHPPKGMSTTDLAAAQHRLADGDFAVGDKVLILVHGDSTFSDTFTVRSGRVLELPTLPPLSVSGVLRSEADSVIAEFLARYIRSPQVTVTPLMRLGIVGGVNKPGYYDVAAQSLLSELVMNAGGLNVVGDMGRSNVFRGNSTVMNSKDISVAISTGQTLDVLNLQSGDNFNVGVKNPNATLTKVQIITAILAIPLLLVTIKSVSGH